MIVNYGTTMNGANNSFARTNKPAFKAVNKEYVKKVQNCAKHNGDAPWEVFFDIARDVYSHKMSTRDGLDTLFAIEPYAKTNETKKLFSKHAKDFMKIEVLNNFFDRLKLK